MQSLHFVGRSLQAFRRIGTLPIYRWKTGYPCIQMLNYSASPVTKDFCPGDLNSQARIHQTLQALKKDFNLTENSVLDKSEQLNRRADFICEQLKKLQKSNCKDKLSANSISPEQVQELFQSIASDPAQLSSNSVIECVTAYVKLCLAVCADEAEKKSCFNLEEYRKFEMHIKKHLDSMSLHYLVMLYNTFFECRLRHPQTVIFIACEKLLTERVSKVTQPDDVVSLCQVIPDSDNENLRESIENCVNQFANNAKMSLQQVMSCLYYVVTRNSPKKVNRQLHSLLIRHILEQETSSLQVGHLSFVTWTMKTVLAGAADPEILQKICDKVVQTQPREGKDELAEDTMKMCYLLSNLDLFQWAEEDVFNLVSYRLLNLRPTTSWVDCVRQILINAANLNIHIASEKALIKRHTDSRKKIKDVYQRVHLLWALCVKGKQDMVSEEIEELFCSSSLLISIEGDKPKKVLKLLRHLRDIAMTVDRPLDSLMFLSELKRLEKQRESHSFENVVCQIIENNFPEGSYCKNVVTSAGHKIDMELYINGSGKAVTVDDEMADIHRVAVKTRGYFTMSRPNNLPLGWVVMENRSLAKEGYTVLEIPYHEWFKQETDTARMAYINAKIKEFVPSKTQTVTN